MFRGAKVRSLPLLLSILAAACGGGAGSPSGSGGAGGQGGSAGAPNNDTPGTDSGCGCSINDSHPGYALWALAGLAIGLGWRRRGRGKKALAS